MTRKLAIVGMGKMGAAIDGLAASRDWQVVARLDEADTKAGISREALNGADVAVEFTVPEAATRNVRSLLGAGCPVVVGTTGWYADLPELSALAQQNGGALLTATNFSLGVNIFEEIVVRAAELLRRAPGFEVH